MSGDVVEKETKPAYGGGGEEEGEEEEVGVDG